MSILRDKFIYVSRPWNTNDITEGVLQGCSEQSEEVKELGYICLSKTCNSPAMWGYYADRSRGACLVFDIDFDEYKQESKCRVCNEVKYSLNRISSNSPIEELLFTKAADWQHEQEYRLLFKLYDLKHCTRMVNGQETVLFYDSKLFKYLSGVILGAHCKKQCAEITAILPQCKKAVTKMQLDSSLFSFQEHRAIPEKDKGDIDNIYTPPNLMDD